MWDIKITKSKFEEIYDKLENWIPSLDSDFYGKQCNFFNRVDDNGCLIFYSRDYCEDITMRELLNWYVERLGESDGFVSSESTSKLFGELFEYCSKLALDGCNIG